MKTFTINSSKGAINLTINSKNTIHVACEEIEYRGKNHRVSAQGGLVNGDIEDFEFQTWLPGGNELRFVQYGDSDYYITNNFHYNYSDNISTTGKVKIYEFLKEEIKKFIKNNQEEVRAAFLEREREDLSKEISGLDSQVYSLTKQIDELRIKSDILCRIYRRKFGGLV